MTSRVLARGRVGTILTFALAGVVCGVWVSRTPALADEFGMGEGEIGVAILLWGIGAIIAMQGLRGVMGRLGSAPVLRVAAPLTTVSLALVGLAPDRPLLYAAVTLFGMAFGLTDIGVNAQGSAVERGYGRSVMNGMHAGWCAGAISGGVLGSLSASAGLSFGQTLIGGAVLTLPAALALGRTYLAKPAAAPAGRSRARLPLAVYLVGALAFAAFMLEGTIADWSGLYLNRELGAGQSVAALGYPLFEAAMLVGRLFGDRIRTRVGTRRLLTYAGLATAAAMSVVVAAPGTPVALGGFWLAGLTVCTIVPMTISAAGTVAPGRPAAAVGQVGAMGYGGLVLGPVVIGFLADAASLRAALCVAVVLALLIAASARFVPMRRFAVAVDRPEADPEKVRLAA